MTAEQTPNSDPVSTAPVEDDAAARHLTDGRDYAMPPVNRLLERVTKDHGKSLGSQLADIARLCLRNHKLNVEEYYELCLYDEDLPAEEKLKFIGSRKIRQISSAIYRDNNFWGVLCDKVAFGAMMKGLGFRAAETLGVFSATHSAPGIECLRSAEDVASFLRRHADIKLFAKPNSAYQSLGSMAIDRVIGGRLQLADGSEVPLDDFVRFVTTGAFADGYLFQARVQPHPEIQRICGNRVATVRFLTAYADQEPHIVRAVIKIPAGDSMADNYWRQGNTIAEIDLEERVVHRPSHAGAEITTLAMSVESGGTPTRPGPRLDPGRYARVERVKSNSLARGAAWKRPTPRAGSARVDGRERCRKGVRDRSRRPRSAPVQRRSDPWVSPRPLAA